MILALLLTPTLAGLLAFILRPNFPRRMLTLLAAIVHFGLICKAWTMPKPIRFGWTPLDDWMAIDELSLLFLTIASLLFLAAAIYVVGYLARESRPDRHDEFDELPFTNFPEATFAGCLLLFLSTMTLVAVSRHMGLMWVAVEATTLASSPLIYFHRNSRSLEATWKYLVICSVGIALALLGNFFLAVAAHTSSGLTIHLTIEALLKNAASLNTLWLKAAFLLLLVGYGTKMGLAPLHTWLPDAHSEAPAVVSALLSGALLNCAFLIILRGHSIMVAAGLADFSRELLILFGLTSMVVAAVFIIGQTDYKRMLAYSSIEHMGILSLGIGVGGLATFGSLLHTVNHSLAKAMLFFAAGNILAWYRTKSTADTRGMKKLLPMTALLWMAGFLAITGSPPFGLFLSELTILKGILDGHHTLVAVVYLSALAVVFVGMASIMLKMIYRPQEETVLTGKKQTRSSPTKPYREPIWSIFSPAVLGVLVLGLGFYVPPELAELLHRAAQIVGGN
jgi:hydrogenase-4 component F